MHYVYVLLLNNSSLYVGQTKDLKRRLKEHIRGTTRSTRARRPRLILYEAYAVDRDAFDRELFLKTGDGRQVLRKQLQHTLSMAPSSNG